MIAYKFLRGDGTGAFTRFPWPLPNGGPGAWVDAPIEPCRSGIHACRASDLPHAVAQAADPPLTAWESVVEPSIAEGPALLGFIAARIAEQRDGLAAYHDERARQVAWLAERLGL